MFGLWRYRVSSSRPCSHSTRATLTAFRLRQPCTGSALFEAVTNADIGPKTTWRPFLKGR